jgi:hypothetical protein
MRVYLFRGLFGGFFSTGMDDLAAKLNADGHVATVHSWVDRKSVEPQAIAKGASEGPICLVGHSLGGNSASYMAHSLIAAGIPVAYVGTVDATAPKPAPGGSVVSDNFRSSDPRDEPVPGATEIPMPHLNHIEIDKDSQVHERIRAQLRALGTGAAVATAGAMGRAIDDAADTAAADPVATALAALEQGKDVDLAKLAPVLAGLLAGDGAAGADKAAAALREELAETVSEATAKSQKLTPVNAALGQGIGKMLNGRKTAFGIIGLLGTTVLPILFPQLAPFQALFKALGATSPELVGGAVATVTDGATTTVPIVHETGKNLLMPIFSALTGWGLLGKIEKWVKGARNR